MQVKDILSVITAYREERGWTEYQLAERSGLPQSTISSWYRKNMVPTIPSLEKICMAFGITLSQLFAEEDSPVTLTDSQRKLLEALISFSEGESSSISLLSFVVRLVISKNSFLLKFHILRFAAGRLIVLLCLPSSCQNGVKKSPHLFRIGGFVVAALQTAARDYQNRRAASAPAGAAATADITGRALLVSVIMMDARGCRVATRIKVSWAA